METTIKNVIEQVREYHQIITKADNDSSLTTIQKSEYDASIKEKFEKKGIKYYKHNVFIHFYFSSLFINDIGVIKDVSEEGSYPIKLETGTNISIEFDPRNLNLPHIYRDANIPGSFGLKSTEYMPLKKGSSYNFYGKVDCCKWNFKLIEEEQFKFYIQNVHGKKVKKEGEGCFVATACYGNYNSPEVLVLRQFRDERLLKTSFGKVFVKFYYSVSPFCAKLISKSEFLKKSVRQYFLEPIVSRIRQQNKSK